MINEEKTAALLAGLPCRPGGDELAEKARRVELARPAYFARSQ